MDIDDDGDNVPTSIEKTNSDNEPVNENGYRDTDEDGIPNYLDPDDDNDGVLTRFEVSEETGLGAPENFETAEGIANYLNKEQTDKLEHNEYIDHKISRNYGYQILIDNLKFERQDGSGEAIQYETYNFGTLRASNVDFPQCPDPGSCM